MSDGDTFSDDGSVTMAGDWEATAKWSKLKRPKHPVTTWKCGVCGFKVTSDTHIRFDEMCEHYGPAPGYTYPWDTYAVLIGDEPLPLGGLLPQAKK